jgi:S-adenosylhomocysteine hydrolase
MVTGQYGVGKSWSFLLYFLLVDKIFRYRHKYCKNINDLPKEIDRTIPKIVYYSMDKDQSL